MDRMRAGLTGLGVVFLFTLAASLAFGPSEDAPAVVASEKEPGEPLAQLGVAPSNENNDEARATDEAAAAAKARETPQPLEPPATESPVAGPPDSRYTPGGDRPVSI